MCEGTCRGQGTSTVLRPGMHVGQACEGRPRCQWPRGAHAAMHAGRRQQPENGRVACLQARRRRWGRALAHPQTCRSCRQCWRCGSAETGRGSVSAGMLGTMRISAGAMVVRCRGNLAGELLKSGQAQATTATCRRSQATQAAATPVSMASRTNTAWDWDSSKRGHYCSKWQRLRATRAHYAELTRELVLAATEARQVVPSLSTASQQGWAGGAVSLEQMTWACKGLRSEEAIRTL